MLTRGCLGTKGTWPDGRPVERTADARLARWIFDPSQTDACAASEPLGDLTDELSRIEDCMMGQHYRNGWLAAHGDRSGATFSRIAHVDRDRPTDADI